MGNAHLCLGFLLSAVLVGLLLIDLGKRVHKHRDLLNDDVLLRPVIPISGDPLHGRERVCAQECFSSYQGTTTEFANGR